MHVCTCRRRHKALLEALLPRHVIAGLHKHNAAEKLGVPPAYTGGCSRGTAG